MTVVTNRPGVPDGAFLLDVRTAPEWRAGHAPDAHHVPLDQLELRLSELPKGHPVYAVCHAGGRSAQATAYLRRQGYDVTNYEGGMLAWRDAGGPLVSDDGSTPDVG